MHHFHSTKFQTLIDRLNTWSSVWATTCTIEEFQTLIDRLNTYILIRGKMQGHRISNPYRQTKHFVFIIPTQVAASIFQTLIDRLNTDVEFMFCIHAYKFQTLIDRLNTYKYRISRSRLGRFQTLIDRLNTKYSPFYKRWNIRISNPYRQTKHYASSLLYSARNLNFKPLQID